MTNCMCVFSVHTNTYIRVQNKYTTPHMKHTESSLGVLLFFLFLVFWSCCFFFSSSTSSSTSHFLFICFALSPFTWILLCLHVSRCVAECMCVCTICIHNVCVCVFVHMLHTKWFVFLSLKMLNMKTSFNSCLCRC